LAEDRDQFADSELGLGEEHEQAQPRGLARGGRGCKEGVKTDRVGHAKPAKKRPALEYADILICKVLFLRFGPRHLSGLAKSKRKVKSIRPVFS
jgi:hypothetical protein